MLGPPAPHVSGALQPPQFWTTPQASVTMPHLPLQAVGSMHWQTWLLHASPPGQLPQVCCLPQTSVMVPQWPEHADGSTQSHLFGVMAPHTCGAVQPPQATG
jgi:hypothetical protein